MEKKLRKNKNIKFFFRYLKSKGLFMKYKKELHKQKSEKIINNIFKRHVEESYFSDIIDYSFCWSNTDDGHNFWSEIDNEFRQYFLYYCRKEHKIENFHYLFKQ